jgi:hypothetical protein
MCTCLVVLCVVYCGLLPVVKPLPPRLWLYCAHRAPRGGESGPASVLILERHVLVGKLAGTYTRTTICSRWICPASRLWAGSSTSSRTRNSHRHTYRQVHAMIWTRHRRLHPPCSFWECRASTFLHSLDQASSFVYSSGTAVACAIGVVNLLTAN